RPPQCFDPRSRTEYCARPGRGCRSDLPLFKGHQRQYRSDLQCGLSSIERCIGYSAGDGAHERSGRANMMRTMATRRSLLSYALGPAALGGLLSPAVSQATTRAAAPEFVGIDGWLNTDGPLTIAGLRGKAVLVEFGTYSCINWRRTLPYVNRWHADYGPQG